MSTDESIENLKQNPLLKKQLEKTLEGSINNLEMILEAIETD